MGSKSLFVYDGMNNTTKRMAVHDIIELANEWIEYLNAEAPESEVMAEVDQLDDAAEFLETINIRIK